MTKCFLKAKIRELEREIMNGRQAAKLAAEHIKELEFYNAKCKQDITAYNQVIEALIRGESPCRWCEDIEECQLEEKNGKGCAEWMLTDKPMIEEVSTVDGENILSGCSPCGE